MRLLALLLLLSSTCFGFENSHFKQSNLEGWSFQAVQGFNYLYYATGSAKDKLPVFVSMSLEKKLDPKATEALLRKNLQDAFKTKKKLVMKKIDKPLKLAYPHAVLEFTYFEEGDLYKGLACIIPGKKFYHYFQFSSGTNYYDTFKKEVVDVLNSTKLK